MDIVHNNFFKGEADVTFMGREHKAKLSMNTFRIISQRFDIKLSDYDTLRQEDPFTALAILAYAALVSGAVSKGEKFDMDFEVFCDAFFDDDEFQAAMTQLFNDANPAANTDDEGK